MIPAENPRLAALRQRYVAAMHAVQSAIAFMLTSVPGFDDRETGAAGAKHLRVGLNVALADHGSLVKLLIDKGLITEEEYYTALAEGAEREKQTMTEDVRRRTGIQNLTFG